MGIRRVTLTFEGVSEPAFTDGESVTAQVEVDVTKPTKARKVQVLVQGAAKCNWRGGNTNYRGNMQYLGECIVVWQPSDPSDVLTVGIHHWSFTFRLPRGLPSSCNIHRGSVTYTARAIVDIPWGFNAEHCVPFTVRKLIEVNVPQLRRLVTKEAEKTLCCCCCKQGSVKLRATINKIGFCNGDTIELKFVAENYSDRDMGSIRVQLVREHVAAVRSHTNKSTKVLCTAQSTEKLTPQSIVTVQKFTMPVHDLSPSVAAQVVFVKYYVEVAIVVPWGINCTVQFDIVVGTVNTSDEERGRAIGQLVNAFLHEVDHSGPIRDDDGSDSLEGLRVNDPPPAYTDCDTMGADKETDRLVSGMYT